MAHLQYMPGDPRLVDQLVCELKSKGIFDQFRKECIADVDTRPAYQNLRQRVETSVSTFLSRQCWKPDLNKNQLREKLRKHILDGNYLEQGVERIVDQVVNPKVASVFIPQVEDLVYNYLGIPRKKAAEPETTETKPEDLLPTDLEAVSPGSVKSNDDNKEVTETDEKSEKMDVDVDKQEVEEKKIETEIKDVEMPEVTIKSNDSGSMDKCLIPLPSEEIKLENIPAPENSPPKSTNTKVELDSIALPHEPNLSTDIPLPEEMPKNEKEQCFKPLQMNSEESNSSSDSSLRRNMSPLTPIRNYNNENSCDAQQGFETDSDAKSDIKTAPSSFRFTIENKDEKFTENSNTNPELAEKKDQIDLSYQFNNQVNINTYNTPMYDDSSNSNNLHIDYESDVNSKTNIELKPDIENSQDSSKKERKSDDKKSSHKSSHRSRDSSRHSSNKDKRSDSKHSTSRDSSRHDKKSSKDDKSKTSKEREISKDRNDRKDSRDSSKHRGSHKSSSKEKDSKSNRSSSSSHRHSSKSSDEKKPSSSSKDKEKTDYSKDKSKDKPRDSKSSSNRDKDKKSSSSNKKSDDKDKKKDKKDTDDHYSSSGRGNHSRRSTDRDSNDGSSSSKGSQNHTNSKSSENKKETKSSSSKSDNTSTSGESPSPSDKEHIIKDNLKMSLFKPIIRVDNHLETPIATPPRLPFVPDVTLKKPKFAANLQEAKKLMKMRKFLDEEQKRMNQEAALLLEFQANVRPSLSQVYSSIPGPELEFACVSTAPVQDSAHYDVNVQTVEYTNVEHNIANLEESTEENKDPNIEMETIPIDAAQISEIIGIDINNDENIIIQEVMVENIDNLSTEEEEMKSDNLNSSQELEDKFDNTYDENKPFSELMDEITEYSKASEIKTKTDIEEKSKTEAHISETKEQNIESKIMETTNSTNTKNKYFEVTIITEELSESEEIDFEPKDVAIEDNNKQEITNATESESKSSVEDNSICEEIEKATENITEVEFTPKPNKLQYFAEHEKYNAELERHEFSNFLKNYLESVNINKKIYIINCDPYEENIVKEVASTMGDFEVINYYKNGHLKLPNTTMNVIKDVPLSNEVVLPIESTKYEENSPLFSPVKSECSFELCSDYDSKLDDINKKSRQEVMEIILGSVLESPSKIPEIDYYSESATEKEKDYYSEITKEKEMDDVISEEKDETECSLNSMEVERETDSFKRSIDEVESSENNNRSVLTPKKIRKMSDSDQISSTTEESEESSNNNKMLSCTRSKYLGKARRVGLPRPKRTNVSNSPSSDKSVENYVQNTPPPPSTPNGKVKSTPRSKVQRYDTSDLYKPKLHYLSRRHNVT